MNFFLYSAFCSKVFLREDSFQFLSYAPNFCSFALSKLAISNPLLFLWVKYTRFYGQFVKKLLALLLSQCFRLKCNYSYIIRCSDGKSKALQFVGISSLFSAPGHNWLRWPC